MKLKDIYSTMIEYGMKTDPRGEKEVKEYLKAENKKYSSMSEKEKQYYDENKLTNPYADSRIIHDSGKDIKTIIAGIDMEVGEILLVEELNRKGAKIDAVYAHHPVGRAYASFYEVMDMQADIFASQGVNIAAAETLTMKRLKDVGEKIAAANHYRAADAARLLDITMFNAHTPTDNCVASYLQNRLDREKPKTLGDVVDMLLEEKEYSEYKKRGAGPSILNGDKSRRVRKAFVDMTGWTEGPKEIYKKLCDAGVDTVVGMHFSPDHKKEISEAGLNCVVAGHIASDALGINVMLDEVERVNGPLKVYETSGFIRVKRSKGKK